MGYDCYVRGYTDPDAPARPDFRQPVTDEAVNTYFAWQDASNTYFRRSIGGIGDLRVALLELGMAFDPAQYGVNTGNSWAGIPAGPELTFPHPDEYGVDSDTPEDSPQYLNYRAAVEKVQRWHGPEVPGIPIHKLCDNSGWIVTKEEAGAALGIYRRHLEAGGTHPVAFEDDLIPFLTKAAAHDGFEVY